MLGEQNFGRQSWPEVRILSLNQLKHVPANAIAQAVCALPAKMKVEAISMKVRSVEMKVT